MGELATFPVSYKVEGQRIVIVGGGDEALNKARLATKTTASVVIVSRHIEADFSGLQLTVHERPFEPGDLVGAALVFVADHGPDGEAAKIAARAQKIPLNVVDVPEECDFYTPAIIDRAPVTIAVASEGDCAGAGAADPLADRGDPVAEPRSAGEPCRLDARPRGDAAARAPAPGAITRSW